MNLSAGHYQSFVVRVWGRDGGIVRGTITHVATRRSIHFRDSRRMLAFIYTHLRRKAEEWPPQLDLTER